MEYEKRKSKAKTPISFKNGNIADPGKELILKNAKNIDKPFFFSFECFLSLDAK